MRHYLFKIAFNKVAGAEDRPAPPAFNSYDEAKKAQYNYMGQSVLGETIGWVMSKIICENGVCNAADDTYWEDPNIIPYYGDMILNGTINSKTNQPWKVDDVPERWRDAVNQYVVSHTEPEPEPSA